MCTTHQDLAEFGAAAQAVMQIIGQVATYDAQQHTAGMATNIKAQAGDADPTPGQVLWALIDLLNESAAGSNLELTMQALGHYHGDPPGEFWREVATSSRERRVVATAQLMCQRLANYLVLLCHRPRHGTSEAW